MVKTVKEGIKNKIECKTCKAILEYEAHDQCAKKVGMNAYEYFITCPCCNNDVVTKKHH